MGDTNPLGHVVTAEPENGTSFAIHVADIGKELCGRVIRIGLDNPTVLQVKIGTTIVNGLSNPCQENNDIRFIFANDLGKSAELMTFAPNTAGVLCALDTDCGESEACWKGICASTWACSEYERLSRHFILWGCNVVFPGRETVRFVSLRI